MKNAKRKNSHIKHKLADLISNLESEVEFEKHDFEIIHWYDKLKDSDIIGLGEFKNYKSHVDIISTLSDMFEISQSRFDNLRVLLVWEDGEDGEGYAGSLFAVLYDIKTGRFMELDAGTDSTCGYEGQFELSPIYEDKDLSEKDKIAFEVEYVLAKPEKLIKGVYKLDNLPDSAKTKLKVFLKKLHKLYIKHEN